MTEKCEHLSTRPSNGGYTCQDCGEAFQSATVATQPQRAGRSYIADDGAHIVETPSGHTFINPEDWY